MTGVQTCALPIFALDGDPRAAEVVGVGEGDLEEAVQVVFVHAPIGVGGHPSDGGFDLPLARVAEVHRGRLVDLRRAQVSKPGKV